MFCCGIGCLRPFCLFQVCEVVHFFPFYVWLVVAISVGFYIDEVGDSVLGEAVSLGHSIVVLRGVGEFIDVGVGGDWDYMVLAFPPFVPFLINILVHNQKIRLSLFRLNPEELLALLLSLLGVLSFWLLLIPSNRINYFFALMSFLMVWTILTVWMWNQSFLGETRFQLFFKGLFVKNWEEVIDKLDFLEFCLRLVLDYAFSDVFVL